MKRLKQTKQVRAREALRNPSLIKAELCRRSYFTFMQEFWGAVSADSPIWNWHIEYLAQELSKIACRVARGDPKSYDLIINLPPGATKSITCSIMFPAWCWTKWPWMRFIVASYSGGLSLEHAEYSRDLIKSDKYRKYFPEIEIKRDKDTKSNFRVQCTTLKKKKIGRGAERFVPTVELGGNRFSTSVGGTLTGFHGHILIVDDPLDPNRSASAVELAATNRWFDQTLSTRKIDKNVTPTILIMQRLHQDDPTGHILGKQKKGIRHICLPGEIRNYADNVRPIEVKDMYCNDLLDYRRMGWRVLEELKADLGQYGYAGQIGQKPAPPGGGMFKTDNFQIVESLPGVVVRTVRFWDKAASAGVGAFTVGVKMHKIAVENMRKNVVENAFKFCISDVKRGQWASDVREKIIRKTAEADGREVVIYHEQEPASGGKESAEATTMNLAGFVNYPSRPKGNKVYRADPYSVQVNSGNVLLLRADWNREFMEEHAYFPFSMYKDQVDAASGAFSKLTRQRRKKFGVWGRKK